MFFKESVARPLWDLLVDLQKSDVFDEYFLVGGTSLSLQIGHRMSDDIDLFTPKDINKDEILDFFNQNYYGKYKIINSQNTIFQLIVNEIKVDFVKHKYNLIEDVKRKDGIKYLGKKDISAIKFMAVANRGDQAKDFVDIYFLLKEIPLKDMFEYYKTKYNQEDVSVIKRSLIYFDDVSQGNWDAVRFLKNNMDTRAQKIKQTLVSELNNYEKGLIEL